MEWWIFVIGLIVYLLIIGLLVDVDLYYNIADNNGRLIVKVFKIPVVYLNLKVEGNAISFVGKNKKKKEKKLIVNLANIEFVKRLKNNIAHRIYVNNLEVDCMLSLTNPAVACVASGAIKNALDTIKYLLTKTHVEAVVDNNVVTGFDKNNLVIFLTANVSFSILDFVWAVAKTVFEKRKNYGKQS